jgi:hypothetical protein
MKVSYCHLKIIKRLNLHRRTVESNNEDIFRAILRELSGSGKCFGYKEMRKRLKLKYGLNAHRSTVIRFMWIADQNGKERRKSKRLLRRKYSCPGPNFVWHIDGYDKQKPLRLQFTGPDTVVKFGCLKLEPVIMTPRLLQNTT